MKYAAGAFTGRVFFVYSGAGSVLLTQLFTFERFIQ